MITNYFKIAFRTLLKFKGYAAINLIGLALGLTAGILIMLYVLDELSFDKFHSKADRIYRIETKFIDKKAGGSGNAHYDANGWAVASTLQKDFPEVEKVVYTRYGGLLLNYEGKRIRERVHFATNEFFDIFSFELSKGNRGRALLEPYSIVITEAMEKKYFKGEDALNKTLIFQDTMQFVVTGVMKDFPTNSHIQVDMLMSFSTYVGLTGFDFNGGWGNINVRNYLLLKEGVDAQAFISKAENLYTERVPDMLKDWGVNAKVVFTPMTKLYLHTDAGNGIGPVGSIDRVYLVSGIAAFVLLLACINFINLTTARSVYRAKEVGLRKVVGSSRFGLVRQFLSESFVLTSFSLVLAMALTGLLLPLFNQLLAKNYSISALLQLPVVVGIVILIAIVTFLSGYYPAWVMSGMRPVEVLKGKIQNTSRGVQLRRSLVVFQFVVSVTLVLGTLIVIQQLRYMQNQNLGFAKDEIFVISAGRAKSPNPEAFETFKNEIRSLAMVNEVTYTNALPGNPGWRGQIAYPEGKSGDEAVAVEYMAIDDSYLSALGLQLVAGRNFSKQHEAELKDGLILNETAVSMFGWDSPQDAIGKKIVSPSGYPAGEVIGVVKDYHELGLQQNIGPMAMDYNPQSSHMYAIRYHAADTRQLISSTETLWKKTFPGFDFNYFFLNQDFERQYQAEKRMATVFGLFAVITIIIAVIGLLGLVSFMVASKTKEIGVRKVLGAGVMNITSLLTKEFLLLVILANIIAYPVAWYLANAWLQSFANRTEVSPLIFVATFAIAISVTLITTSFQTIRAAMTDPVKSLRYE
jgi:putative ABC transport system permease protein